MFDWSDKRSEADRVRRGVTLFFNDGGTKKSSDESGVIPGVEIRTGVCAKPTDLRPPRLGVADEVSSMPLLRPRITGGSSTSDISDNDEITLTSSAAAVSYTANLPAWPLGTSILRWNNGNSPRSKCNPDSRIRCSLANVSFILLLLPLRLPVLVRLVERDRVAGAVVAGEKRIVVQSAWSNDANAS